jgi:LuxR family maltose regulon positive regulatory protein
MPQPLLETKLFLPAPRPGLVPRPRLRARLDRGLTSRLMLVSAPAGFGKTTLLVDWLSSLSASSGGRPRSAWLALDPADNDPARFWSYVIAALRTALPDVGSNALALLQDSQPPPVELLLTTLINELGTADGDVVLLLDDYHVIDSAAVQAGMGFLLEHLPARLHLVVASRVDPALPLPRLRARGDLVEVRAVDLRFTADEAADYLNGAMGLRLSTADVEALEARTEGWVAALQLAALSMTGRDNVSGFIAGFAGDDRYVVDYLVEEVLQRQPEDVQAFLLRTSVLDRMNGSLCDAVTRQRRGRAMLEALDRENLFVVALDDRRQWYRYHHLFADVLRGRLLDEQPELLAPLHALACDWYERSGDPVEAIRHAVAGGDLSRAADLVERVIPTMRRDRQEVTLRGWLEVLPAGVIRLRPVLCNALAGSRLSTGTFDGVEELLSVAQQWLDQADDAEASEAASTDMVVVDHEEFRRLPAEVAFHRAGLALVRGDADGTIRFARHALELAVDDDHLSRGAANALTGLAAWSKGDLETARSSYAACLVEFERINYVSDVLGCSITLADIEITQGRLRDAMRTYQAALDLHERHHTPVQRGRADMHVGIAARHRELNDLATARQHLMQADGLGEYASLPQNAYRWRVAMAQVCEAEGDLDAAFDLLDEAERLYEGDFSPNVRPVTALRARTQARHGRLDEALDWVDRQQLSVTDELSYLQEYEHLTLARVLIAQHARDGEAGTLAQAIDLLERLLRAATDGQRRGSVIEVRVAQALAHQVRGESVEAVAALQAALDLAEPEGYVRTFIDEGSPLMPLLTAAAEQLPSAYARRLLAAMAAASSADPHAQAPSPRTSGGMVEPLSGRERDVLRLLDTELNGPQIARQLVVSLNTVRTHTKNVYLKLGVTNRRAAIVRARELDLL